MCILFFGFTRMIFISTYFLVHITTAHKLQYYSEAPIICSGEFKIEIMKLAKKT